jgi:hypothetical protein
MGPIRGGIEYFTVRFADGRIEEDCQCARCGSSVECLTCWDCGGEGDHGSACWDDLCHGNEECIHGDADLIVCDTCGGAGGTLHCISPREWCEAHPLPGREHIPSTTLRPEAWTDAL